MRGNRLKSLFLLIHFNCKGANMGLLAEVDPKSTPDKLGVFIKDEHGNIIINIWISEWATVKRSVIVEPIEENITVKRR